MIRSFFASEFRQNVMKVLSANVISQAIALLVYPLVTRMYTPEEFGVFNVFLSICSVFFVISTGRYENAIVQPKRIKDAAAVFHLSMTIVLAISILLALIVSFFKSQIMSLFSITALGNGIWFLPVLVFLNGAGIVWCRWFNRLKQYEAIGAYQVVQSFVNSAGKVLFGWLTWTQWGLVLSSFLSYLLSLVFALFVKSKTRVSLFLFRYDTQRIKSVARQYDAYPKYSLPHSFVNMLSGNLPMLMLAPYFSEKLIGFYALSVSIGFRPINLISTSLNQVLFQRVAELYNGRKSIISAVITHVRKAFLISFPLFGVLYFALPFLVTFLFGSDWEETASLLQIQLPWFFACLFGATFAFIPVIFLKQKTAFLIESISAVCRFCALLTGVYIQSFKISIIAFTWVSIFFILVQIVWFYLLLLKYEKEIRK